MIRGRVIPKDSDKAWLLSAFIHVHLLPAIEAWCLLKGFPKLFAVFCCIALTSPSIILGQAQDPISDLPYPAFRQRIIKLVNSGQLQEAQERVNEELAIRGESANTLYLEALILFKQRQHKESMQKLERSLALKQGDPEVHKLLALNAVVLNRLDIVEPELKTTLRLAPNDFMAHFHLGLLYYTTNRFALAKSEFGKVTELQPTYMKGYEYLGLAQEELEDDQAVLTSYQKAVQLTEQQKLRDESPSLRLAKFLWVRSRFQESLEPARRAIELNPKSAEAYYVLGRVLDKLGQQDRAIKALQKCTEVDVNYTEAHYLLSRIFLRQGDEQHARQELEQFNKTKSNRHDPSDHRR